MENNYKVYKHIFPNGKVYIGITKQSLERRWRSNGIGYKYQQSAVLIWKAIQKYGWENVKHEVLYEGLSRKEACELEKKLIKDTDAMNRDFGYNLAPGGSYGTGLEKMSEDVKTKISKANKGNQYSLGYKWTEEQKQHLREARAKQDFSFLIGRKMPDDFKETRRKRWSGENNPNFNNALSEETKEKRRKSLMGRSCWNKGKKMSEESRRKMSEAKKKGFVPWNKGVPCSEETKKKISESRKKHNASRNI